MKKLLLVLLITATVVITANAQVAVKPAGSGTTADPSAMLDVQSTNKGALLPRMTATQRLAIANPATGLMVYDTDSSAFMLKNAGGWVKLQSTSDVLWKRSGNKTYIDSNSSVGVNVTSNIIGNYNASLVVASGINKSGITVESSNQTDARAINANSYATDGIGVSAFSRGLRGTGVIGQADSTYGVGVVGYGNKASSIGVAGHSTNGVAGDFNSENGVGIQVNRFVLDSNTKAIITYSGNSGFGVSNPNQKLEVAGAVKLADTTTSIVATDGTIRYNAAQGFQGKHGNSWQNLGGSGSSQWTTNGNTIYNKNNNVGIGLDSAEFTKKSGGNLIYTGNLNVHATGSNYHPAIRVHSDGRYNYGVYSTTAGDNADAIYGEANYPGSSGVTGIGTTGVSGYSTYGKGGLFISDSGTALSVLVPNTSGFVSGAKGLIVKGANSAFGLQAPFPNTMLTVVAEQTNHTGAYISGNGNGAALLTTGRVGINTLTPWTDAVLDVNGDMYIRGGNPGAGKVLTSDASGKTSWQQPTGGTPYTAGTGINISGTNVISSTTPAYAAGDGINISGNIISSTAPIYTAGDGINISGNTISSALQAGSGITISGNTISANGAGGWLKSGASISLQSTTDYVGIGTAGNAGSKLRVVSNNEAGISVNSGGTGVNAIFANTAGTDAIAANLIAGSGAKGLSVSSLNATAAEFFSQNAAAISVNPSSSNSKIAIVVPFDNSGFGTTNPTDKIHIVGNATLRYQDGNEAAGKVLTSDVNGRASWQTANNQWTTNGANVYNNNAGNVGVGTTNPQAKLDVDGVVKIGSLVGSFNPANGMIAYTGTDFMGFHNGWKSLTTGTTYTAGSGINISGATISTIPQTLSIVGDSLALSNGGGKVALPSGGSGSSQWTTSGNNIYNNNSGKVLMGDAPYNTAGFSPRFQIRDNTTTSGGGQQVMASVVQATTPYSVAMFIADSSLSGNPKGAQGALGNPSLPGNAAIHAYSKNGDAIYGNTQNGRGLYMYGGNSTYPAAQIEHNVGSTGLAIKTLGGIDVTGYLRLNDGTQQAGRVLTTDANGYASWQAATGGTTYNAGTGIAISGGTISTNLTGGTGISISGNTISSALVAGSGISISGNTISATGAAGVGGWLKTGTDVSLQNTTDYVGIGTAGNAGAKLRVVSNNESGLSVISGGAATNAIFASGAGTNAVVASLLASGGAKGLSVSSTDATAAQFFSENAASVNVNPTSSTSKIAIVVPFDNSGFGTTNPTAKVHINGINGFRYQDGNSQLSGKVLTSDANGNASWQTPASGGSTAWSVDAGNNIYNTNTSSTVGVGLSTGINTNYKLHAKNSGSSSVALFESGTGSTNVSLKNSNGITAGLTALNNDLNIATYLNGSNVGNINFTTGFSTNLSIDAATNNVGIGTLNPAQKLDVNGALKLGTTTTNSLGTIRFNGSDFQGYTGGAWKSLTGNGLWSLDNNNAIFDNNKVGIGTTTPTEKLDVNGAIKLGYTVSNNAGTVRFNGSDFEGYNGTEWKSLTSQSPWMVNGTSVDLINTSNNIGIGASAVNEKLEVAGGIKLGFASATPTAGTMQYNGGLQVHNGIDWVSLNPQFNLDASNNLSNITAANIGLGTATPVEKLDVAGGIKVGASFGSNEGTIRYMSNEFEGFDGTSWKSLTGKGLWNKTGADLSLATSTDNVGIGTATPAGKLHIENSGTQLIVKEASASAAKINFMNDGTAAFWGLNGYSDVTNTSANFSMNYNGTNLFTVNGAGDATLAGTLTQASDIRLKRNIAPLGSVLNKIKSVGAFTYNWIDEKKDQTQQIGFLAQDLEKQFPQLVKTDANGTKSVAYSNMVPVLLQAVKDQQAQIETLQQQLKSQNDEMAKRLELLEKILLNQNAEKVVTTKK